MTLRRGRTPRVNCKGPNRERRRQWHCYATLWISGFVCVSCANANDSNRSASAPLRQANVEKTSDALCGTPRDISIEGLRSALIYETGKSTTLELSNKPLGCGVPFWTEGASPPDEPCTRSRPAWWTRFSFQVPVLLEPGRYPLQVEFGSHVRQETRLTGSASQRCVRAQRVAPVLGSDATLVIERVLDNCVFGRIEGVFPIDFNNATRGNFSLDVNGPFAARRCS